MSLLFPATESLMPECFLPDIRRPQFTIQAENESGQAPICPDELKPPKRSFACFGPTYYVIFHIGLPEP